MDEGSAITLLERLGCNRIRKSGSEIVSQCPFAENHWRGDRSPSFSAKIEDSGSSPYFCFSCHEKGTLEGLAIRFGHKDLVPDWKPRKVRETDWMVIPKTNAGMFNHLYRQNRGPVIFEEHLIKPFVGRVAGYMLRRGVTIDTAREWELGIDKQNNRSIFVLRSVDGLIAMVMGRDMSGRSKVKYTNYVLDKRDDILRPFIDHKREEDFQGPTKIYFLYGEFQAWKAAQGKMERRSGDLIVVEGQTDTLSMWQNGWNVVGIMGSYPSDEQIEKLVTLVPKGGRLISLMDGDKAGRKCANVLGEAISERLPFFIGDIGDGLDPDNASEKQVELAIENSQLFSLTSKT